MTDKLRELLEDVQTVYEGKRMVVHPNSFDRLRFEVFSLSKKVANLENLIHAERKRQEQCNDIHLRTIAELEKENAELKEISVMQSDFAMQLDKAKYLIKNLIRVTWGEGWNYDLGWKVEVENFLKEAEE